MADLRNLERDLTVERLSAPRDFLMKFACDHSLPLSGRLGAIPDRLALDHRELELARTVLLDAGRSDFDSPSGRAKWCLRDFPPAVLIELQTGIPLNSPSLCPAPVSLVAQGVAPADALGERRKWATYEDLKRELARRLGLAVGWAQHASPPEKAVPPVLEFGTVGAFDALTELEAFRTAAATPVDPNDPVLTILTDLRPILMVRSAIDTDRVAWMTMWSFRGSENTEKSAEQLVMIRWAISSLSDAAAGVIADLSRLLRQQFLATTRLKDHDTGTLAMMGLGEVPAADPPPEEAAFLSQPTAAELVDVGLDGNSFATVEAHKVAGIHAQAWPWVRKITEALSIAANDTRRSPLGRQIARERIESITRALVALGSGDTEADETRERRSLIEVETPLLREQQKVLRRERKRGLRSSLSAPLLPQLLERGYTDDQLRGLYTHDDVDTLLGERLGITADRVKQIRKKLPSSPRHTRK